MTTKAGASELFARRFGGGRAPEVISVPGRVNLIGEHIDYHDLAVLPMAVPRAIRIAYRARTDGLLRAASGDGYGELELRVEGEHVAGAPGDWGNYVKAAILAARSRWRVSRGIEAAVVSDLPPAAGLSSSSALLTGFTLALLRANGIEPGFEELMAVLPEGEHFVGTRGGGMDHAAVLACRAGAALLVEFAPVAVTPIAIPAGWEFLVAHSLVTAEKSGAVREKYNSRRVAGTAGLKRLGYESFREALASASIEELTTRARSELAGEELLCFLHVAAEAARVRAAAAALRAADLEEFGGLLDASHTSLRDQLLISCPELDALVEAARAAGAVGARLTGAGFGGCAVILCRQGERSAVRERLARGHYASRRGFDAANHLIDAEPSAGALFA
ncbi:MAG: galactokinase [Bryobacteraceae bacterium]|nr:galactokinase [Bryobacteraceae bacterium]